jgi:predicted DNA-binding WGR domain protein
MNSQLLISNHQRTHDSRSVPSWQRTIEFARLEPEHNRYRSYRLELTQDLFGNWALVRSWGRIGGTPRTKVEYFVFRFDAKDQAQRIIRRRLAHGYQITATS